MVNNALETGTWSSFQPGAISGSLRTMSLTLRIALSLAAAFVPLTAVHAADYDPPIFVEEADEYVPVEVGSGWYLRGDVGYAIDARIGQVDYRTYDGLNYGSASFATQEIDSNLTFGGGFGYRYNEWLRGDATIDGFRTDFNGTTTSATPCSVDASFVGTTCRSEDGSEVSVLSVMANGYVDLGTFVGVTPYIGAGAGYSYVSWGDLNNATFCVPGGAPCPAPGGVVTSTVHGGEDGWRFTYALMAGFAYDLTRNFKLDFGYKYRNVAGGNMFKWDGASAGLGATGSQGTHGDIESHEFKVGLRYELW
jgi:opacity protein-like surface antigen